MFNQFNIPKGNTYNVGDFLGDFQYLNCNRYSLFTLYADTLGLTVIGLKREDCFYGHYSERSWA